MLDYKSTYIAAAGIGNTSTYTFTNVYNDDVLLEANEGVIVSGRYTITGETTTWLDLPITTYSLGVTSNGTGRVSNSASRFSTANPDTPNGILIPSGKTLYFKGLTSGTYPLRYDYVYSTTNAVNPPAGSTTAIEGLVGTASNYVSTDYFPCNTEGADTSSVTNSFGADYYFWFGFAGLTKAEAIQADIDTYNIQYYVA